MTRHIRLKALEEGKPKRDLTLWILTFIALGIALALAIMIWG